MQPPPPPPPSFPLPLKALLSGGPENLALLTYAPGLRKKTQCEVKQWCHAWLSIASSCLWERALIFHSATLLRSLVILTDALDALPSAANSTTDSNPCTLLPETSAESSQLDNPTTCLSSPGDNLPGIHYKLLFLYLRKKKKNSLK